jgi:hypothetical protein
MHTDTYTHIYYLFYESRLTGHAHLLHGTTVLSKWPSFTKITNNDRVYGNYRNHYDNQGLERIDIFNSLDVNC